MWATVWVRGERGTICAVIHDDYPVPMIRVLFADGRQGLHKLAELGTK